MPFGRLKRTRLKNASRIHRRQLKMLTFTNSNMPNSKHPFKALKRITAVQLNTKPSVASAEQSLNTYPPVSCCFLYGWWVLITNPWKCFWLMGSWPNFLLTTSGSSFLPLSNWFSPFRHQSCPAGNFFIVIALVPVWHVSEILTEMPRGSHSPPPFSETSSRLLWSWHWSSQKLFLDPCPLFTFHTFSLWLWLVILLLSFCTTNFVLDISMVSLMN